MLLPNRNRRFACTVPGCDEYFKSTSGRTHHISAKHLNINHEIPPPRHASHASPSPAPDNMNFDAEGPDQAANAPPPQPIPQPAPPRPRVAMKTHPYLTGELYCHHRCTSRLLRLQCPTRTTVQCSGGTSASGCTSYGAATSAWGWLWSVWVARSV